MGSFLFKKKIDLGRADVWLTIFYFDKVPTGCQVSNAGTDVCVRVRERVSARASECECECACVCVRECVCASVCVRECSHTTRKGPGMTRDVIM